MTFDFKDLRIGLIFVVIGLLFGGHAYLNITLGTPARMGPGFFPIVLASVLVFLGVLICVQAFRASPSPSQPVAWRGLALVILAPIVFGLTVNRLGFVPAVAMTALLSALASRTMGYGRALVISAGLTALCVGIFILGLGIPIRLFGPWPFG